MKTLKNRVRIQAMLHSSLIQMKKVKIKFWEYHGIPSMMSLLLAFEFKNPLKILYPAKY